MDETASTGPGSAKLPPLSGPKHRSGAGALQWLRREGWVLLAGLGHLVLPSDCAGCGRPDSVLCSLCTRRLRQLTARPGFAGSRAQGVASLLDGGLRVYAAGPYREQLAAAILAYKEGPAGALRRPLAAALGRVLRLAWQDTAVVAPERTFLVPIPASAAGFRRRGFEPVAVLLGAVPGASTRGLTVLRRRWRPLAGREQKSMGRAARQRRIRGAFRVSRRVLVPNGTSCIVVDDVLTTGATLAEAVRVLQLAGFRPVAAVVLAEVDGDQGSHIGFPAKYWWRGGEPNATMD